MLCVLDYGLYQLLMTFSFGGTLVLERSFAYPAQILKTMEEERVTGFPGAVWPPAGPCADCPVAERRC